jgi:hypothetical protein
MIILQLILTGKQDFQPVYTLVLVYIAGLGYLFTMADKTHINKTILSGLSQSISQLENVVSASLRPLPTETGNGTYIAEATETGLVAGLVQDMANVDVGDIRTLVEVIKNSATGVPVDDKSYVMERTIQVVYAAIVKRHGRASWLINLNHLASCWFACHIAKWG